MTDTPGRRILVPVEDTVTLRDTVAHVAATAAQAATPDTPVSIHFVYAEMWRRGDPHFAERDTAHRDLLEQAAIWAETDLAEATDAPDAVEAAAITVETASISSDRYLFSPTDYADELVAYAETHDLDRVILDPGYDPVGNSALLDPLAGELERRGLDVEQAPVARSARRRAFPQPRGVLQFLAIFGVSYLFYLVLAWFGSALDFVTGAIGAAIVGVALTRVSLTEPLSPAQTVGRLLRVGLYVPFLLWEVTKANLSIARVILDPRLPIDPSVVRFRAAVWGGLPITTLANSITLTPGTLTIDVGDQEYLVHTLTADSREDLLDGALERAVRFVFWGRRAARIPSPRERERNREGRDSE